MGQVTPWYQQFELDGKLTTRKGFMNKEYFDLIRPLFPDNLKGSVILDLCCNAGFVSFELAKLGAKVHGFELNPAYLAQAKQVSRFVKTDVEFHLANVEHVEFSFYKPDIIVALSCLYHLKDPLETIRRICEQPALIIVSFRENLFEPYINYFKLFDRKLFGTVNYGKKIAARFI